MSEGSSSGWIFTTLGEVVDVLDSIRVPVNSDERKNRRGDIPYYGATGQVGTIDDFLFNEELILLGEDGAPFLESSKPKAYLIRGKSWVNNHAHVLRAAMGVSSNFILHQLNQVDYRTFVSGTTRLKLPQAQMRQIPIRLAPAREQNEIVAEIEKQFTRLDAAVVALKRVQANLKRYRAAVLKAACEGRLVPTEAELARKEGRSYETGEQLLARILKERHAKWEADQLAKMQASGKPPKNDDWKNKYDEPESPGSIRHATLPEGWTWASVKQASLKVQYGTSSKSDDVGEVAVLGMGNITTDGSINQNKLKFLPVEHAEFPELLLLAGDILFNRTNSAELVGKTGVYRGMPSPCSFASYLIRVVAAENCSSSYIAACLNSGYGRAWIKSVVNQQVGQANVNGTKLQAFVFPLPPFAEQKRIVQRIEEIFSVASSSEKEFQDNLARADRLRQAILKRAFEGKLVPQDPNDEPASALLERIRAEREFHLKTKSTKLRKKEILENVSV